MTPKRKKAKQKRARPKRGRVKRLQASAEDEVFLQDEGAARWNRPQKQRVSMRVDREVVDWLKSQGPGYQTRLNGILRRAMVEGKKRTERE